MAIIVLTASLLRSNVLTRKLIERRRDMFRMHFMRSGIWFVPRIAAFGLTFVVSTLPAFSQTGDLRSDYFPLRKGSSWVYSASVEWTTGDSRQGTSRVRKEKVIWKSEVTDVANRGRIRAARLRGFIDDLCWYEEGRKRGDYIIIQVGATHYHLLNKADGDVEEIWNKLIASENNPWFEALDAGNLMIEAPLVGGAVFGEFAETPRGQYCNLVTAKRLFNLREVKGAPRINGATEFLIRFWINPEHTVTGFVPGVGVTSFEFEHHGTVARCHAKLIEFHP